MWVVIDEFPEYEISETGQVRSNRIPSDGRKNRLKPQHLMAGFVNTLGYHSVMLRLPGETKPHRRSVHRLVALAFIPNPLGLSDVAHNDGNPSNNNKENLRWATHQENQMDMRKHGTMQDGEKSNTCKITTQIALDIRTKAQELGRGSGVLLAKEYGLSTAQISRIVSGRRWAHL